MAPAKTERKVKLDLTINIPTAIMLMGMTVTGVKWTAGVVQDREARLKRLETNEVANFEQHRMIISNLSIIAERQKWVVTNLAALGAKIDSLPFPY